MARGNSYPVQLRGAIEVETAKAYKFWPIPDDDVFFVWVPKSQIHLSKSDIDLDQDGKRESTIWVTEWWYSQSGIAEKKRGEAVPARSRTQNDAPAKVKKPYPSDDDDEIPF